MSGESLGPADFPPFGDWSDPGTAIGAAALIEDQAGRVLMQLRDDIPSIPAPGLWCLPGGGVEAGEALETAVLRELEEETGLVVPQGRLVPFMRVLTIEHRRTQLFVFRGRMAIDPAQIRIGEGAGMALLTPSQIAAYPTVAPIASLVSCYFAQA